MSTTISQLRVERLFGRLDIDVSFNPDINVFYGRNGTGKTTVLHIIANIFNASFDRFAYLPFRRIEAGLSNGLNITVQIIPEGPRLPGIIQVAFNGTTVKSFPIVDVTTPRERRPDEIESELAEADALRTQMGVIEPAYFPAFRTMIEAWSSVASEDAVRNALRHAPNSSDYEYASAVRRWGVNNRLGIRRRSPILTALARALFGEFVPPLNYPSPLEIEEELTFEVESAILRVANTNQNLLTEAFIQAFAALTVQHVAPLEGPEIILEQIKHLFDELDASRIRSTAGASASEGDVYENLRKLLPTIRLQTESSGIAGNILEVYRQSLERRVAFQQTTFAGINRYLDAVNHFLEGKHLAVVQNTEVRRRRPLVRLEYDNGSTTPLRALSSGERQIIGMIYASSRINRQGSIVLIDEPEISLHIDWQRHLLERMVEQLGERQIIVFTHSPEIGADYEYAYQELTPSISQVIVVPGGDTSDDPLTDSEVDA